MHYAWHLWPSIYHENICASNNTSGSLHVHVCTQGQKCIRKYHLRNGGHFVQGETRQNATGSRGFRKWVTSAEYSRTWMSKTDTVLRQCLNTWNSEHRLFMLLFSFIIYIYIYVGHHNVVCFVTLVIWKSQNSTCHFWFAWKYFIKMWHFIHYRMTEIHDIPSCNTFGCIFYC